MKTAEQKLGELLDSLDALYFCPANEMMEKEWVIRYSDLQKVIHEFKQLP